MYFQSFKGFSWLLIKEQNHLEARTFRNSDTSLLRNHEKLNGDRIVRLRMSLLPCSLALWTCAVAASGATSSTSQESPLFSQVGSEPLGASASSERLAACVEACLAKTHVAVAEASDEVGRVREMFMAQLRRLELAHQKELAQLHLRIGQLVAAQRGPATQRLAQVETLGIESQMSSLGQGTIPPFPGSRPTQAVTSAASRPWPSRWVHQAGTPESDGRKEKDRETAPGGRNTVLQLGPVASSSRVLLQEHEESTDGTCSTDDLMAVQADPVAAVVQLMETNMECALCIIPCGSAANTLACAVRCIKQARPESRLDSPSPKACELALCGR
jgi:hypothetical protein